MTANTVNGGGNGARSGAQTLVLLGTPLNVFLLEALADGPRQQSQLRRACGSPAQTTLRAQLKRLAEIGAIEQRRRNRFPGVLEYELTSSGHELIAVQEVVRRWLAHSPGGELTLGSGAAKAAVRALAEAWSTTMLRALAAGPLSLTELDGVISALSYPSLERRLAAMRLAGLIEARPGNSRGTPYAITDWQRLGMGPIAAAARWEMRNLARRSAPISRLDVETGFLLATPRLCLSEEPSGTCRLAAEVPSGNDGGLAGAMVRVDPDGTIGSCTTNLRGNPDAWAIGTPAAWLNAVIERDLDGLELGGDRALARTLIESLHSTLFGLSSRSALDSEHTIRDDRSN